MAGWFRFARNNDSGRGENGGNIYAVVARSEAAKQSKHRYRLFCAKGAAMIQATSWFHPERGHLRQFASSRLMGD